MESKVNEVTVSLDGIHKPHILNIQMDAKPQKVELDGTSLESSQYSFDSKRSKLIIRSDKYVNGKYRIIK